MTRAGPDRERASIRAEAAAWLALLQSESRTPSDEAGFRAWLAQGKGRQEAFDSLTMAWEIAGGLAAEYPDAEFMPKPVRRARVPHAVIAVSSGAALLLASLGALALARSGAAAYATGPGETRRVAVSDGSTVLLDSDTAIRVQPSPGRRDFTVVRGRAHFEVAKDPSRPFVVAAGSRKVTAFGTVFDVAQQPARTTVVLLEGRVAVESRGVLSAEVAQIMSPGERLTFEQGGPTRADRPDLVKLTAWQSAQAVFNDDTMAEAAAELNRYSRRPLVIVDPRVAQMRVSGVFRAGATQAFATSVAALLPIQVSVKPDRIVVTGRAAGG